MELKDLCLSLIYCESEKEVIDILKKEGLWDNKDDWQYFGGDENNYSIIGNQQSKPEAAIVEKIINSVDAMLMSSCLEKGINPESSDSPRNIIEALEKFYEIFEGKLTNLGSRTRSKLAENICLIATGSKINPNLIIVDKGEGQTPAKLPDTILSLGKSNKLRIPFVQGKYNMGGTGILRFCGERNIQLILSKRNPKINNKLDSTKDFWGFTIVRRDDPSEGTRSSCYKYLAPSRNILFFQADELPILPNEYPNAYGNEMLWGTYIKLYEYDIGTGLRSNIILDLYKKLSLLMPHIALPIKLYERREGYKGNSYETIISGLTVRVDEDRSENIEDGFPTTGTLVANGQKMKYSIYVFKKGKHENYTKDEGIVLTVNGQTHGYISKTFFNRKNVGMNYLSESILIILDCSELDGRAREDLFMNSRDRLCAGPLKNAIEYQLEDIIKNHNGLKNLKETRRKEDIENKLSDSKPLVKVLENIIRNSPTLSKLLIFGTKIHNPFNTTFAGQKENFIGKDFPTYFTLIKKYPKNSPKTAHLNSKFRVDYKTDVKNNYFFRDKDQGDFKLYIDGIESEDVNINIWNGYAHLNVILEGYKIGDIVHIKNEVFDVHMTQPISEEFYVIISDPINSLTNGGGKRKLPSSDEAGTNSNKPQGFSTPNIFDVHKDEWSKYGFNDKSAISVRGGEEGYDFYINLDNIYLLSELKNSKNKDIKSTEAKYKFGLVLIGMAIINYQNNNEESENNEKDIYKDVQETCKALSPIIIPMIDSLGELNEEENSFINN